MLGSSSLGSATVLNKISSSEELVPSSNTECFIDIISSSKGGQGRRHVAVERHHICAQVICLTKALSQFFITVCHWEAPAPYSSAEERTTRIFCSC